MLFAALLIVGSSAQADTVKITFVGAPTGVTDGPDYVLPYELNITAVREMNFEFPPKLCKWIG